MATTWKDKLTGQMPQEWEREIDNFEAQMLLRKAQKIEDKVFAELRLRRGAYGQRYDNGQRHDGLTTQKLPYSPLTKGPETHWDAPGVSEVVVPRALTATAPMAPTRSAGDSAPTLRARPSRSCMGRRPRNFSFQMVNCRSKSRKLEKATRSIPSTAAAARMARKGTAASLCKLQRGSDSSVRCSRLRPVS